MRQREIERGEKVEAEAELEDVAAVEVVVEDMVEEETVEEVVKNVVLF